MNSDKPLFLLPEDVQRIIGKDAQRNNIQSAKMVSEIVKTTLGPKGMDKMLVSSDGDIIVTNDGVTILEEMQIDHPVARMMVEIARTQEDQVGDGTTTAVMIAGKLLENAEKLIDQKIHPTIITKGYRLASEKAQEILKNTSIRIIPEDEEVLKQIAMTAMTGKGAEDSKEKFSEIIVRAIKQVRSEGKINLEDIQIEKVTGEGIKDTELISGVVLEKEKISYEMPKKIEDAKIALISFSLELKNPDLDTKISISSPEQLQSFIDKEESEIQKMIQKIKDSGANVLFCQKGIDELAQYLLAKEKIYACRRVSKSDMEKISKATKGKIVSNINEISSEHLGYSKYVTEKRHSGQTLTYIEGCENPKSITILIHGGTEHVMDEIERALKDGLGDVACSIDSGYVVPGGGAIEIELSKELRKFGQTLSGREQLAVEEFASALEFIPITLAENAGMDPIDILTEMKSMHDSGDKSAGLNLFKNKVENVVESRIIEPLKIKSQAISSASEVAIMILRIDDVIGRSDKKRSRKNINFNDSEDYENSMKNIY